MHRRKRYPNRKTYRSPKKPATPHIKPGADAKLKQVFAQIGVPDKQAFLPDPFQREALAAIERTDCLVTAPTGAGKTWIAEKAITRIRAQAGRSWYACPLKALSNSKYSEFCSIFGPENVGILTGDRKENTQASIIVGTTEILRNQLYDAMHRGETLSSDFVVLDEAHYLGDPDRGVVWEEIFIYLPRRIPVLLLSATIGNADRIAAWLSSIRSKPCTVVNETRRPVPLYPLFLHPSGTLLPFMVPAKSAGKSKLYKKVIGFLKTNKPRRRRRQKDTATVGDILRVLRKFHLLPAIFFLKSRADCDRAVEMCKQNTLTDPRRKKQISQTISEFSVQCPHFLNHRQLWHLKTLAVGSHHSGQLPTWKLMLEQLMTAGSLDAVFATSTVSAGVNFPARSVVFFNSDRFNGTQFLPLTATEFHQMTGRAGRRGMDNIGFALVVPDRFMDIRWVAKLLDSPAADVISQIRINFSMVLNLLLSHKPGEIENLLNKSFATYLIKNSAWQSPVKSISKNLWQDFLRHLDFLKNTGFVTTAGDLTEDGKWASQLRVDHPLLIAQCFRQKLLPVTQPDLLAAMMASFVNERESDDRAAAKIMPKQLRQSFLRMARGLSPFARQMTKSGFDVRPLYMRPAAAILAWVSGSSWETVQQISEMEEGDLSMLILRTADNLRHIRSLQRVFPDAADTAAEAIDVMLREPVVYY
jgi:superfamily II RNA helicase